jgi:pimeloyl-ACP methyl ester carboxylesterase
VLFRSLRARGYTVKALERFGHDPRYPVTSNWRHLVQQLADFAAPHAAAHPGPVVLAGHSLGGFLSVMCAARHPELGGRPVDGLLLLDSPLLGGWRARTLEVMKLTQLVGSVSPGRISRKRRQHWPDLEAVREHFRHKRAFARWHPAVLEDYVQHGTVEQPGPDGRVRRELAFDREVETAIYNTLPHNLDRLLKRHPLRCPAGFIGAADSQELRQVGLSMTRKVVGTDDPERLRIVEGSHLFPMERPQETAAEMDAMIRRLLAA